MAPNVSQLRKKLGYPLYGADFDPLNPDFLIVGGGGGSSSTGVPNKISLVDTSRRDELNEVADIELAKDEDSVTTLAVASSSEHALTAIAGINSSLTEQEAGRNEHLRSFRIPLPARKRRADGSVVEKTESPGRGSQALSKHALFKSANGPKNETYQRVLRTSSIKSKSEPRIAAIASGLAPENEIIVFQPVSNAVTSTVDEISRISLGKKEAADVDIVAVEEGHCLAYCTDDAVFIQQLPRTKGSRIEEPVKVYETTESTSSIASAKRPKFRAIRFITPKHILLLQNQPGRSGVSLLILKLISETSSGRITLRKTLTKSTKSAVGLDVCPLTADSTGQFQTIIAVAALDSSIELLTIDYTKSSGLSRFKSCGHLRNIHNGPLTRIVFSNFLQPATPANKTLPQLVRLASVGVDQTAVVHTLHLRPWPAESHEPRYVFTDPGAGALQTASSIFVAVFVITLVAVLMQAFCEIRGALPPTLNAQSYLSPRISSMIARPYYSAHAPSVPLDAASSSIASIINAISAAPSAIPTDWRVPSLFDLQEQLSEHVAAAAEKVESGAEQVGLKTPKAIIVRDTGTELSAELHHDLDLVKEETMRKWEELSPVQQHSWKQRLLETGHWVEEHGEKVLKGIFFSQMGEFVGAVAREGI